MSRSGRFPEAESRLLDAHAALDSLVGPDHGETRQVVEFLVELYGAWGNEELERRYRRILDPSG